MQATSVLNSIPYVLFFIYLILLFVKERNSFIEKKDTWGIQILVALSVFLFIGFRGLIYTDWVNYYTAYQNFPSLENFNFDRIDDGWEVGFIIYSVLLKTLGFDYWGWVIISTFIDIVILHYFFKSRFLGHYTLAFLAFYIYSGLSIEVNLMRNAKAIMLFLISISFLERRKLLPYILFNALGFLFHYSALLYLPLFFFLNKKVSKRIFCLIFIIGNIIYLCDVHFLSSCLLYISDLLGGRSLQLIFYMDSGERGITIGYIERFFFFFLIYYFYTKLQKGGFQVCINLYILYVIFCFYFSEFSVISDRLSLLFIVSYWLLIPIIYSFFSIKTKRIFLSLLFVYGILKIGMANLSIVCKYDNLLFGIEQYESRLDKFYRFYQE